jgi:hypothetical protein
MESRFKSAIFTPFICELNRLRSIVNCRTTINNDFPKNYTFLYVNDWLVLQFFKSDILIFLQNLDTYQICLLILMMKHVRMMNMSEKFYLNIKQYRFF